MTKLERNGGELLVDVSPCVPYFTAKVMAPRTSNGITHVCIYVKGRAVLVLQCSCRTLEHHSQPKLVSQTADVSNGTAKWRRITERRLLNK